MSFSTKRQESVIFYSIKRIELLKGNIKRYCSKYIHSFFKNILVYGIGAVFASAFLHAENFHSVQTQSKCKELFTPETFAKAMTENLEIGREQEELFDLYRFNYFGDPKTYIGYNFTDVMSALDDHPEFSKKIFRDQKINFEKRNYEIPESLKDFAKRFTDLYSSQKGKLFHVSENLHFWKKILNFKTQKGFAEYLAGFLTEENIDFLADTSISYRERAIFLYKVLNKLREVQMQNGKEVQRISQIMLDLVHTIGLADPYNSILLKSENAKDRIEALHKILSARDEMAVDLGFDGPFSKIQKALGIAGSPSSFSKKEDIYEMLRRIEEEVYQSSSQLVDSQTFRLRALSLQESPFRSCLGADCSSNQYFLKALDPNFIYWTLTDKDHRSSGHITVVLGEAKDKKGDIVRVGFVDKIQNVLKEKIEPMLEGIRRSLKEEGYKLGLPQDVGYHDDLSNVTATREYVAKEINSKLKREFLEFEPHKHSYNSSKGYSRAYEQPALYEFQAGVLDLGVKIESGERYLAQKAPETLKKEDIFDQILSLKSSKKEEDQIQFIRQAELLYNLKILSFKELKEYLVDRVKDRGLSFKLRKLSFFSLIELYESSEVKLNYKKLMEFLSEFSKEEQKNLIGEMSNWKKGNNLNRRTFILDLLLNKNRSEKEIISILNSDILKPLIDINQKDVSDRNALIWAVINNHKALVELLIKKGIDIHEVDSIKKNALMWAIMRNHKSIAALLIEKGINMSAVDSTGKNALMLAMEHDRQSLAELLIEKGIDIHAVDSNSRNALMLAMEYGRQSLAELLIKKDIDIHAVDSDGKNALMLAMEYGRQSLAELLIKKGIDIHAMDLTGRNALMWAIIENRKALAELLIRKGIDIHAVDLTGRNALMWAIIRDHKALVHLLIEKGIDIHAVSSTGKNALTLAIEYNRQFLAKFLIDKGFNIHTLDSYYKSGLRYIMEYKGKDLFRPLKQTKKAGAK